MRRAVERAELRRREVPDARPLREAGFAALRDTGFAVLREAGFAVLRDAGFEAEARLDVLRFAVVERLRGEVLLLAAEPDPDAALARVPPVAFREVPARDFEAVRFGALPLLRAPVVRFDVLDFGCGICSLPSMRRTSRGYRNYRVGGFRVPAR